MSLLSWFAPKKARALQSMAPSSGLSRLDSTRPFNAARQAATAQPANRKQERLAHRELLYAVVRECMVRAGVLSSSYKFKVLSLDPRGSQFMVMVDLAQGASRDTSRLAEIEALIAQSAKARYGILVTAVYWRANEHVAIGDPAPPVQLPKAVSPAQQAKAAQPVPAAQARPAPPPHVDPLQAEEVAAFRKALAAGVRGEQALAAAGASEQNYTLLTGFEDTEMADHAAREPLDRLSGTQYGDLR